MKKTIKSNTQLIDYYRYSQNPTCVCTPLIEKTFSSQTNYANISNNMRIANILTSSLGGKTQFEKNILSNVGTGIGLGPRNKF